MRDKTNIFIKLLDKNAANALNACGFSYTIEKINDNETVYCFEPSTELLKAIQEFNNNCNYEADLVVVEGNTLCF